MDGLMDERMHQKMRLPTPHLKLFTFLNRLEQRPQDHHQQQPRDQGHVDRRNHPALQLQRALRRQNLPFQTHPGAAGSVATSPTFASMTTTSTVIPLICFRAKILKKKWLVPRGGGLDKKREKLELHNSFLGRGLTKKNRNLELYCAFLGGA